MNYSSTLYFLVSTRALYFHVNKNYFYAIVAVFIFLMIVTENLIFVSAICFSLFIAGSYISRGNPDFFDIYIEGLRFSLKNQLHPKQTLSLFKIKTNGVRKWEA